MFLRVVLVSMTAAMLLMGCSPKPVARTVPFTYIVQPGDTVYSISFRHGLSWQDVARWNGIEPPRYLIRPGQRLSLWPPAGDTRTATTPASTAPRPTTPPRTTTTPSTPPQVGRDNRVTFLWPTAGDVISRFNDAGGVGKGIAIAGRVGQAVNAAASGRVVYTGSGLIGYGELIIIKHNDQLLSAYAHNREILVREGDDVRAGQRIATMGEGPGRRAMLHFEIRVDGQAVDPLRHLPDGR